MNYDNFIENISNKAVKTFVDMFKKVTIPIHYRVDNMIKFGDAELGIPSFSALFNEFFVAESASLGIPAFYSEHFAGAALTPIHELLLVTELNKARGKEFTFNERESVKQLLDNIIDSKPSVLPSAFFRVLTSDGYYWRNIIDTERFAKLPAMSQDLNFVRQIISMPYKASDSVHKPLALLLKSSWVYSPIAKDWKTYDFTFEMPSIISHYTGFLNEYESASTSASKACVST